MESFDNEFEKYQKAKKQVEEIKGFYTHLASFIIFNLIILFINLKYTPQVLWFFWTTVGWGIGVFFHAAKVFDFFPYFTKDWEEKKIKQFMEEEQFENKKFK
jgi:hypothetical protein